MQEKLKVLAGHIFDLLVVMRKAWNRAVDLIYPPCCPFCDNALKQQEYLNRICKDCQKELVYITRNYCLKCGKPIFSERTEYCYDCSRHSHYFDQARAILSYQGRTKEALSRFKRSNRREYASFFGEEICRVLGRWIYSCNGDYVIPVPLYYKNEGARGYNQAALLAEAISKNTGIPVCENLLQKSSETKQQKDLDRKERGKNLEQAFVILPEYEYLLKGKTVILIDDIYTTGATADAAAKVLRMAGAKGVFVITVAVGG